MKTKILDTSINGYNASYTYMRAINEGWRTEVIQLEFRDNCWFTWLAEIPEARPCREPNRVYADVINEWLYKHNDEGVSCAYSSDITQVLADIFSYDSHTIDILERLYIEISNKIIMRLCEVD